MIRSLLLILCALGIAESVGAQEITRSDLMGNRYRWEGQTLLKCNAQNQPLYTWQNPSGGSLTWVDPADPFRILTFSKESNQLLWLDNKLVPIGNPIVLNQLNLLRISGICSSKDGGIWLFNPGKNTLLKMNHRLETVLEVPLRISSEQSTDFWMPMLEWKQKLYLLLPGVKVLIADLYGQILKQIPLAVNSLDISPAGPVFITETDSLVYEPDKSSLKSLIKKP